MNCVSFTKDVIFSKDYIFNNLQQNANVKNYSNKDVIFSKDYIFIGNNFRILQVTLQF
jgi:hypothetical protein